MAYVDGFVIPIPKRNVAAYQRIARRAGRIWMDLGALAYYETVGDDLGNDWGVPFPKLARVKSGETVVFSWILYRSKAHRDRVNKALMTDPRMKRMMAMKMPFDMKRMSYGGFRSLVAM